MHYLSGYTALGQITGDTIPEQYLVPMSKYDIDKLIDDERRLGKKSKYFVGCDSGWAGTEAPCHAAMLMIERYNLYYVNGLIPYGDDPLEYKGSLLWAYNEAAKTLEKMPYFPPFKERLKSAGTGLLTAIAGFYTMGPVGFFIGLGKSIAADLRKLKADKAAMSRQKILQNNPLEKFNIDTIKLQRAAEAIKNFFRDKRTIVGLASAAVIMTGLWIISDD